MLADSLTASTHHNDAYAGVKVAGLHQHETGNLYTIKQLKHSWSQQHRVEILATWSPRLAYNCILGDKM